MQHTYNPAVTVAKGATEGTSAGLIAAVVATVFEVPAEQAAQIAGLVGIAVAGWKSFRNWRKNRKAK